MPRLTRLQAAVLLALLAAAAFIRIEAARDDFLLDEIWSLTRVEETMSSPLDGIGKNIHDNNHILNTIFLYLMGARTDWIWYRSLSLLTGTALVVLLGLAWRGRGFLETFTPMFLGAFAWPLIVYSAEARGYAAAGFFSLAAFLLAGRYRRSRRGALLPLFWIACLLGFLAHFTFAFVYFSIALCSLLAEGRSGFSRGKAIAELAKCHAIPAASLVALFVVHIRHVVVVGGPIYPVVETVRETFLVLSGLPGGGVAVELLAAAGVIAAALAGARIIRSEGSSEWFFFPLVLFFAPALALALLRPSFLYFRYFLVCFPFFYLLLGILLARIYRRSTVGKFVYLLVLLVFLCGNGLRTARLIGTGRGNYKEAIEYMAGRTRGEEIVVGSDHDFRNKLVLRYYLPFLPEGKTMRYVDQRRIVPGAGPEWMIAHSLDAAFTPKEELPMPGGLYRLDRAFPFCGVSGFSWFLYRRGDSPFPSADHP